MLDGYFNLQAYGKTTDPISYNSTSQDIAVALSSIGVPVIDVSMWKDDPNYSRERYWKVTFDAVDYSYDIPLLESTYDGSLRGNEAKVYHQEIRRGVHGPQGA